MKNKMALLVVFVISGCAGTYRAPSAVDAVYSRQFNGSSAVVFNSAQQQLALMGYTIQLADVESGVISTSPKSVKLQPGDADCGTTMGLDYLRDKRTNNTVAINVVIASGTVTVKSNLFGEYRPGDVTQNITLSCISRGTIENEILNRVL